MDCNYAWIILVATGGLIIGVGYFSYRKALNENSDSTIKYSLMIVTIISFGLFFSAVLGIWLLFQEFE
jgi:hypothetical protein